MEIKMMRNTLPLAIALTLIVGACSKADTQADALDNAANQADPAAAAVMRNEADMIRANGTQGDLSAPGAPVQEAMTKAGAAAANSSTAPGVTPATADRLAAPAPDTTAKPHRAGDPVPPPQRN